MSGEIVAFLHEFPQIVGALIALCGAFGGMIFQRQLQRQGRLSLFVNEMRYLGGSEYGAIRLRFPLEFFNDTDLRTALRAVRVRFCKGRRTLQEFEGSETVIDLPSRQIVSLSLTVDLGQSPTITTGQPATPEMLSQVMEADRIVLVASKANARFFRRFTRYLDKNATPIMRQIKEDVDATRAAHQSTEKV